MCVSRIVEELFPFGHYFRNARRLNLRCTSDKILRAGNFSDYPTLAPEQLSQRLEEERRRGSALDEKTFKLTLSLSIGLTVLGLTAAFLVKAILFPVVQVILVTLIGCGLFYVLAAGFVAIGALRTSPSYGYGTQFVLQQQKNPRTVPAEALARQETMNNIRHLRNETAYEALRNGFLLFFAGMLLFAATLCYQTLCAGC